MSLYHTSLQVTMSIRIVADYGIQTFQFTKKLKRATNSKFTIISAIIFIHYACCTRYKKTVIKSDKEGVIY